MFNICILIIVLLGTFVIFREYFFYKDLFSKMFFGIIICSLLLYSGIGAALVDTHSYYIYYYFVYIMFVYIGIRFSLNKSCSLKQGYVESFIINYANIIVYLYVILNCIRLVYPENKLLNLIHPPSPDLKEVFFQRFESGKESILSLIVSFILNFLQPFFYLSLYYYRNKWWRVGILLTVLMYISYCSTGYIGRGAILLNVSIYMFLLYMWNPQLRKKIITGMIIFLPFLFTFFVNYASVRIGGESLSLSLTETLESLFLSESYYPLHFASLYEREYFTQDAIDYCYWLFTLPSPISLNFFGFDFGTNYKISEFLLNIPRGDSGFYVLLPGMVGEAYYLFKDFFWLHGLLYGIIIGVTYSFVRGKDFFSPLGIYLALILGYYCTRGGTAGAYPFVLKQFLYLIIVLKLYQNRPIKFVCRS